MLSGLARHEVAPGYAHVHLVRQRSGSTITTSPRVVPGPGQYPAPQRRQHSGTGQTPTIKNPFDRLLIAQANTEDATLLSKDAAFAEYSVEVLW